MNLIDILILVPIAIAVYRGFKRGFIIELFTLLAILVGIYVGIHFSDFTANWLKETFEWNSPYLPVVAFTVTFLAVGALIYFGGKVLEQMIKVVQLTPLNKALGMVFSGIKGVYIVSVLLVLLESYDEKSHFFPKESKEGSMLYEPVKNVASTTVPAIAQSPIFLNNSLREESDSTGLTIDQILRAKEVADSLGIDASDAKKIMEVHQKYNVTSK
jgi:membrane protein required for colicin V production